MIMAGKIESHQTTVALLREVPAEVDAGTDIVLQVKVSCADGCDLRGRAVKIMTPEGPIAESELVKFEEKVNETVPPKANDTKSALASALGWTGPEPAGISLGCFSNLDFPI
jgi:hypothetical protein